MKRTLMVFCGLLLVLALAACGSRELNRQPENSVSAVNSKQISLSSAENSEPIAQASMESSEQAFNSVVSGEYTEEVSVVSDVADRLIQITTGKGDEIIFQLNESSAASSLYHQLPLSAWVEDYAGSEKTFYPPEKLDISDTPPAQGPAGTLAYYAPWGNVAIFYEECGGAAGLYELGEALTGAEFISTMTGEVQMKAIGASSVSSGFAESESILSQQAQPLLPSSLESPASQESTGEMSSEEDKAIKLNLQIGSSTFTATLEENKAADSFAALMKSAPLVIQMSDYSGFEKVGSLGTSLPADSHQITTQSGDIVLYNGNQIVIFYGSNSWSYTRLGKIDDLTGWEEALGNGDVSVTFSLG